MRTVLRAAMLLALPVPGWAQGAAPVLTSQTSGTSKLLQAISVVNDRVVWVSGHGATYAHTSDGGATWQAAVMPGDTTLQFRDVQAFDENTAYLMTSGTGKASRVYFTADGGKNWTLQQTNPDSAGFYDCFAFFDRQHALLTGDEVDGQAVVLTMSDGVHWTRIPPARLPVPRKGEGSFAASGECIVTVGRHAWIGTGAGLIARVFHSPDRGQSWTAVETPVAHETATGGISAVAFRDTLNGIVVGGDNAKPEIFSDNVAVTTDGGKTWSLGGRPAISGGLYGAVYVPGADPPTVVAVGPKGATYSTDNGKSWRALDNRSYWSVGFASAGIGWLVGPGGRITKVVFPR